MWNRARSGGDSSVECSTTCKVCSRSQLLVAHLPQSWVVDPLLDCFAAGPGSISGFP